MAGRITAHKVAQARHTPRTCLSSLIVPVWCWYSNLHVLYLASIYISIHALRLESIGGLSGHIKKSGGQSGEERCVRRPLSCPSRCVEAIGLDLAAHSPVWRESHRPDVMVAWSLPPTSPPLSAWIHYTTIER